MANINNNALFLHKTLEFRTRGGSMDNFRASYVNCANEAIQWINLAADLETPIAIISDTEGEIGLDDLYRYPFSQLLSLSLWTHGARPFKGGEPYYNDLKREQDELVDECRQGIINAQSDADTDDDTYDIVGLGAIG